ncbi:GON-4-like protein isoform X3 [Labrus mixtus]|uniref:GON-4-like protein isoform X3 n=1 Tax=Labrus mixtus TaxID=508554 RepID=UPI0029C070F1|nr:GON-4-like protein isoform X3 [Labrus mixtus]
MAAGFTLRTVRRRSAEDDICFLESKSVRLEAETNALRWNRKSHTGSEDGQDEERKPVSGGGMVVTMETSDDSEDEMGRLDIDLDMKSKQHNLTSSNVRSILHEVITHEHVVAMMKATIRDTQDLPMFEPKMTRSRLKQVIQLGQSENWSLSAVETVKPPQFVDIDLEEDEDSSDEEYCPDEEEEEEDTTEEMFLSDIDSLTSPPRTLQRPQSEHPEHLRTNSLPQRFPGRLKNQVMTFTCTPQHLLAAPESSFLERLNAVDEELDCSPTYSCNQSLDRKKSDENDEGSLAYRTRSKLRLVNVPLGQLEAELLAPDITADMYEQNPAQREEDRHWTRWLQGLMAPDNEEEADDEDDPEYNFLEEHDEPDVEDYRTDRAVQITKKEVNELLDELFDTEEEQQQEEEQEEEESHQESHLESLTGTKFNVPKALRFEAPLASMLTERRRTVRQQYEALQQKRALQDTTNQQRNNTHLNHTPAPQSHTTTPLQVVSPNCPPFQLDHTQKLQLQQQVQQHVQLLTQIHLLAYRLETLNHETCITKHYLEELQQFARRQEEVLRPSSFRVCNLKGALDLLKEEERRGKPPPAPPAPAASRRLLPSMTPSTNSLAFPLLPADLAWLFATRPVFLYPELLPVCNMDVVSIRQQRNVYTAGEDGLIVLGLKHFEGTVEPDHLISSYLLRKTRWNFRKHVREMSGPRALQNNVIKMFLMQGVVPPLPLACCRVQPADQRPPVERNSSNMPNWLKNSQMIIQKTRLDSNSYPPSLPPGCTLRLHPYWLTKSYPAATPHRRIFKLAHNASLLPLAKAPEDRQADVKADRQVHMQPMSLLSPPPPGFAELAALSQPYGAVPLAAVQTVPAPPACPTVTKSCLPIGQRLHQSFFMKQKSSSTPLFLPLPSLTYPDTTSPIMPCSATALKPGYFVLRMVWTPPAQPTALPTATSQPKAPPTATSQPKAPPTATSQPKAPPTATSQPKAPPTATSQPKAPPTATSQPKAPPTANSHHKAPPTANSHHKAPPTANSHHKAPSTATSQHKAPPTATSQHKAPPTANSQPIGPSTANSHHAVKQKFEISVNEEQEDIEPHSTRPLLPVDKRQEEEESFTSTINPRLSCAGQKEKEEEDLPGPVLVTLNGGEKSGEEEEDRREEGGGEGEEDAGGGGAGGQEGEEEQEEEQREGGEGEKEEDGEKDKDEDQDQQGEEEEEEDEDFDDLTQDEDEEEVMSSASEESVLSVPELQETMKQLTWLAAERRLCADGDSEEDHSPTSPGSQEEEEEEEEEVPKEEESGEGRGTKEIRGEGTPRGGGNRPGRGRGRSRPLRGLRRSRQERHSVDTTKLLLLYDENILDNDPHRESKDVAFAQSYLNRVREALQDLPGQAGEFVSLLSEFEQAGEGQELIMLFRKLRCILGDRTDLLRDFAAFLHPEQALQCGLFEEQQAFERSRRFLRQVEISFGDNPSHYQKIIKALQTGPDLSPISVQELKSQMATLLKGHNHLQNEFWVFFDNLRPPPAHLGQFEEAHWPEEEGTEVIGHESGGGASSGFEEVTLPELEEEEEGQKIAPLTSRRQRRKMDAHRNYKDCDWSDKDWSCLCPHSKIRRHRRKGCSRCHGNKTSGGVSRAMKSLDPLYSQIRSDHHQPGEDLEMKGDDDSPQPDCSSASWEGSFPLTEEKEEEEEEELDEVEDDEDEEESKSSEKEQSPTVKRSKREETLQTPTASIIITSSISPTTSSTPHPSTTSSTTTSSNPSMTTSSISPTSSNPHPSITSSTTTTSSNPHPSITTSSNPHPSITSSTSSTTTSSNPHPSTTTSSNPHPFITSSTPHPSITSSTTSSNPHPSITSSTSSTTTSSNPHPSTTTSSNPHPFITSSTPHPSITSSTTSSNPHPSMTTSSTPHPSITSSTTSSNPHPSMTTSSTPHPSMTTSSTLHPSITSSTTSSNPHPSMTTSSTPHPSITSSTTSSNPHPSITSSTTSSNPHPSITSSTTSSNPHPSITSTSPVSSHSSSSVSPFTSISSSSTSSICPAVCTSSPPSSPPSAPPRPSPPPDLPVCAKNISLTASGEKVILWTREADRVILTTCQKDGANQNTFQAISILLGNKTPSEVSRRFQDLMRLFRTAARHSNSEDVTPPTEPATANEGED